MNHKISILSRVVLVISAAMLVTSIFVPIWRIELDAPQYPEGLHLLIYANKMGGQVDIINGLNHYIGMQTLHAENFIEFTLLPYIIAAYALLMLLAAGVGTKKLLNITFGAFVTFGIVAMADFWRWEYDYGHNLDPTAAIIVPGMAYQPPLIGFKQLLNFGAFSVPDIGGWLFVGAGALILFSVAGEAGWLNKLRKKRPVAALTLLALFALGTVSCNTTDAQPITLHTDTCTYCQMPIADGRFGAEVITQKGRVYKFDDLYCLQKYCAENTSVGFAAWFVNNYKGGNVLVDATTAYYISDASINSPMNGNTAAFETHAEAEEFAHELSTTVQVWSDLQFP